MDDKKIDELFQNQLQNLEVSPNKRVWNNIETKLKKKKRRVFPFWLFTGSIAAILILGFIIFPFSKDVNNIIKINSDEIITATPKKNTTILPKIDSIITHQNKTNKILITQKNNDFEIQNKVENSLNNQEKKEFYNHKKVVKKIALNQPIIGVHYFDTKQQTTFKIKEKLVKNLDKKSTTKKIDIYSFLQQKDSSKIDKKTNKGWSVAPVFAVLKSNSFSNTSPIESSLATSTEGENSFSYGVQIAYKINKKWTIRSGVHLQENGYSNNQIAVFSAPESIGSTTEFENGESFSFDKNIAEKANFSLNSLASITKTSNSSGNLAQNYGYIEIPLEVKYNLSNLKNFETQIVSGFSSLFLNKNTLNLNVQNQIKEGKSKNLNSINFSGNLGFDFNYLFNKNWSLNVNPMLKVQLNTFNENANGFAPFNVGIYSGITYKF